MCRAAEAYLLSGSMHFSGRYSAINLYFSGVIYAISFTSVFGSFSEADLCNSDTYIIEFCGANAYNLWGNFGDTPIYRKRNNFAGCLAYRCSIFIHVSRIERFNNADDRYWSCGRSECSKHTKQFTQTLQLFVLLQLMCERTVVCTLFTENVGFLNKV